MVVVLLLMMINDGRVARLPLRLKVLPILVESLPFRTALT